jgi:hypothetical protein
MFNESSRLEKSEATPLHQLTITRVTMEIIDSNCQPDINRYRQLLETILLFVTAYFVSTSLSI